ncbi:hypothetical protein [Corynebacterium hiratae]|uniref:Uncharacterized protein n=1 Tax=Corynebacterium hiratae TaxID=3139423 RepID=A0A553G1K5_9CORY|nr:hypothetical protein [Corynebacterium aurimucosum]TRX63384.1 hypothetical protein FNY97_02970 [Corynebacterium aurimucosum]
MDSRYSARAIATACRKKESASISAQNAPAAEAAPHTAARGPSPSSSPTALDDAPTRSQRAIASPATAEVSAS